jgi:hypothetical protein
MPPALVHLGRRVEVESLRAQRGALRAKALFKSSRVNQVIAADDFATIQRGIAHCSE